jgi:hypothetical protein
MMRRAPVVITLLTIWIGRAAPAGAQATSTQFTGSWRSVAASAGGIGGLFDFHTDGTLEFRPGAVVEGQYRVDGNRLFTVHLGSPAGQPSEEVMIIESVTTERLRFTTTPTPTSGSLGFDLVRVGAPENSDNLLLGTWVTVAMRGDLGTGPVPPESASTWQFLADGTEVFLQPFPRTDHGHYSVEGDRIRLDIDGRVVEGPLRWEGDTLVLPSPSGRSESRFKRYASDVAMTAARQTSALPPRSTEDRAAALKDTLTKLEEKNADPLALNMFCRMAVEAGEIDAARTCAERMLASAEKNAERLKTQHLYGDSLNKAHTLVGRVALRRGDVAAARQHLLAAGDVPGDGTLTSFGPNMALAKELLERGERDVVIQYFDLCAKFWTFDRGQLARWKAAVKNGEVPEFGASLVY